MITSFFAPKPKRPPSSSSSLSSLSFDRSHVDQPVAAGMANDNDESNKRQKLEHPTTFQAKTLSPEVEQLLSYLRDPIDGSTPTWRHALVGHTSSSSFERLAKFVVSERKNQTVYPPPPDTFSALNLTPLKDVKVVIVGQDPYHGPNQGHGLCFSVRRGIKVPPSLMNIYKELKNDPNVDFPIGGVMPTHGYLERWARQGVLMLNAVLTVRRGSPNSHGKKGWESFTDEVIRILDRESEKCKKGIVFLLWGKPASAKAQAILRGGARKQRHTVICTSHPSPLGATKTTSPFLGSKCFSRANDALQQLGMDPIDWNVDGDL